MVSRKIEKNDAQLLCGTVLAVLLVIAVSAFGQTSQKPASALPAAATPTPERIRGAYPVGPGDVLDIRVADAPELSGKYRISESGELTLPLISAPIKASGTSTVELARNIAQALKAAEILREPLVNVFVDQYKSRNVMVLGAVAKPGVYSLEKRTTVLELLSQAGGLMPTAGYTVTVAPKSIPPTGEELSVIVPAPDAPTTMTIDLGKLVSGRDPSLNVEVHPGDVVSVPAAQIVYVVGAVGRPGGFPLQDAKSGLTVLQALALAEGFKSTASPGRAVIVRRSNDGKARQVIPVNLGRMMTGKLADRPLEGNDILFIPESSFKKGMTKLADAALSSASQVAGYGFGLRIAPPR